MMTNSLACNRLLIGILVVGSQYDGLKMGLVVQILTSSEDWRKKGKTEEE